MKKQKILLPRYEQQKIREGFSFVIGCDEVGRGCLAGPVVAAAVALPLQVLSASRRTKFEVLKWGRIADSKVLSQRERERLDAIIRQQGIGWGIGIVSEKIVDKINIHNASLLAMKKAVGDLLQRLQKKNQAVGDSENFFVSFGATISSECIRVEKSIFDTGLSNRSLHSPSDVMKISQRETFGFSRDGALSCFLVLDGKFIIPSFTVQQEAIIDGDAKILSIAAASIVAKVYRDKLMKKFSVKYPDYNFARHKGYATLEHRTAIKKFGLTPLHRKSFCKKYIK